MKNKTTKFALAGASVLCVLGALTSCEKVSQQDLTISGANTQASTAARPRPLPRFNGSECTGTGGNCLGDVIVIAHPTQRAALNTAFTTMTGNPGAVKAFFTGSDWKTYFPSLATHDTQPFLTRLQSGDCDIKRVELGDRVYCYAGAGELTVEKNEVVMPISYTK